jgi:hypothetical protein
MALLILMWTAVDLVHPSACALDASPAGVAAMQASDAVRVPLGAVPSGHVDDCFCCSHCVHPTATAAAATSRALVVPRADRYRDRLPSADRAAVYHPPQVRS